VFIGGDIFLVKLTCALAIVNEAQFATSRSENIQRTSRPNPKEAGERSGVLALQQAGSGGNCQDR
jgi:hypothetical protein